MKIFFILILSNIIYAQDYTIINEENKQVIPFATIKYIGIEKGVYSNEKGVFNLEQSISDSISISSIGYYRTKIAVLNIRDSIFLTPKTELLNEVIITHEVQEKEIGLHKKPSNFSWSIKPSREFITYLNLSQKYHNAHIKKVHFPIKKPWVSSKKDTKAVVRVNIYLSSDNIVDEKVFQSKSIYFQINKSKLLTFDLSDALIDIDSSNIYIGLELIGFINNKGEILINSDDSLRIPFTKKKTKDFDSETFVKLIFSKKSEWEPLNNIISKKIGVNNNYYLPIGLTLSLYEN